jgi:hypothetical protein
MMLEGNTRFANHGRFGKAFVFKIVAVSRDALNEQIHGRR